MPRAYGGRGSMSMSISTGRYRLEGSGLHVGIETPNLLKMSLRPLRPTHSLPALLRGVPQRRRWSCDCGHEWDLHQWTEIQCLSCSRWSPHLEWYAQSRARLHRRHTLSPRLGAFELCRQANERCIFAKARREENADGKTVRSPMQRYRH
jgi:hypothetical protein